MLVACRQSVLNCWGDEGDVSTLCDPRLKHLEIGFWTSVPIGDVLASRAISLYLKTDHPLLELFEPNLFISDLVSHRNHFCSAVLVNALDHASHPNIAMVVFEKPC